MVLCRILLAGICFISPAPFRFLPDSTITLKPWVKLESPQTWWKSHNGRAPRDEQKCWNAAVWQGKLGEGTLQHGVPRDEHCKAHTFRECGLLVKLDSRFISAQDALTKWTESQRSHWFLKWFLLYNRETKWFMSLSGSGCCLLKKILPSPKCHELQMNQRVMCMCVWVRVYAHMYLRACPLSSLPLWFGSQLHCVPALTLQANCNYNVEQSFPRQTKSVFH